MLLMLVRFNVQIFVKCCRLEQCLKEITDYVDELSSDTLQCSADAAGALKQISDCRLMEKHTCCNVSMDSVQQILREMVSTSSVVLLFWP